MSSTDERSAPTRRPTGLPTSGRAGQDGARRGDIEGLRAVAVLAVVAFHGALPWAPGGFVGVDVFFVISGFLITGLMLRDVERTGRVRLGEFYARRARRILPLAGVVVLVTLLATIAVRPPLATVGVARDAVATMLYASNWWFLHQQTDYLGSTAPPSPLLHFWSLSVEEQFYLVWPLVVLAVALLLRRHPRRRRAVLLLVAACAALVSFALSVWWTATVEPRAYLATPTRVWQFMAGAVLAIGAPLVVRLADGVWARSPSALRALRWACGAGGLLALAWSVRRLDAEDAYPGWLALVPTLGTAAVVLAGGLLDPAGGGASTAREGGPTWLLARRPLRAIGRVSYAWYLWHWPLVVLVPYALGDDRRPAELGWPALCALSVGAVLPAWLSMRLVEDPVRFAPAFASVKRGLAVGAVAAVVPVAGALVVGGAAAAALAPAPAIPAAAVTAAMAHPVSDDPLGPGRGSVQPGPGEALDDVPAWRDCFVTVHETSSPPCRFGAAAARTRVVVFGDSHAAQWLTPLDRIGRQEGLRIDLRAKASCIAADYDVDSVPLGRLYRECRTWREGVMREVEADPPDLVLLAAYNAADRPTWGEGWDRSLRRLLATGTRVVYLRPTPIPAFDVPTCISGALDRWARCAVPAANRAPDPVADAIAAGAYPGAMVLDVSRYLCDDHGCPAVRDHVLVYRDRSHLTDTAARGLEPVLRTALDRVLQAAPRRAG